MANKPSRANADWVLEKDAYKTLLNQDGVNRWVEDLTEKVEERAIQIARQEAFDSGAYVNSFKSRIEKTRKGDRSIGIVEVTDNKWHWIEYGTRRQPAKSILRRAVNELRGGK